MKQCTCYALRAVDCTCMPAKYEEIYEIYTTPDQEPVAWRTFDGEGGYDYRTYDTNEDYADEWEKRNPNHKGWVEPLYKDPKPCPTCEALARTVMLDQTSHDTRPQPQRTEQEPVIDKSAAIRIATALGWEPKREWVGLTDEEIEIIYAECNVWDKFEYERMLEAKLKEKNNG